MNGPESGERLVEHHADAVPVAGLSGRAASRLLGGHVGRRPGGLQPGALVLRDGRHLGDEAEVQDDDAAVPGHEHVLGLDVAVDPARAVERGEALGELQKRGAQASPVARLRRTGAGRARGSSTVSSSSRPAGDATAAAALNGGGAFSLEVRKERNAVHELHREEPLLAVAHELVELGQVGMGQVGERAEFLLEAVDRGGVRLLEHLERDGRAALAIEGLVDRAEGAGPQAALDREPVRSREGFGLDAQVCPPGLRGARAGNRRQEGRDPKELASQSNAARRGGSSFFPVLAHVRAVRRA